MTDRQWRWILAGVSAALVTLPFLFVTFPPSVDLPQHVAQVRLFSEALHDPAGLYKIQWFTPYSAITMLLGLIWQVAGPLATGRIGLIVLGLMWTGAAHWLAATRKRPAEAAVLASLLYLGLSTYWGFCSFLIGWPPFLVWFERTTRPVETFRKRDAASLAGLAVVLYLCHALWFATAMGWWLVSLIMQRPPRRVLLWQLVALAPLQLFALYWWKELAVSAFGFKHGLVWLEPIYARLSFQWFVGATFYGLKDHTDALALGAILGWCALSIGRNFRGFFSTLDRPLFAVSLCMFAGILTLPNSVSFTIFLPERFVAPALILLLLALPPPRLPAALQRGIAAAVLLAFCTSVALNWKSFEEKWMTGFAGAVEALPPEMPLLGLDYIHRNSNVQAPVFMHLTSYAQALKGGTVASSFAEMPSALVVFKEPRRKWTARLEWFTEKVQRSDFDYFSYALVGVPDRRSLKIAAGLPLDPVTTTGKWRLFKVRASSGRPDAPEMKLTSPQ
jgi:hypothetical protein